MKHTQKITYILLGIFLLSQIIGLVVILKNSNVIETTNMNTGETSKEIQYTETPYVETPEFKNKTTSFLIIFSAIIVGTIMGLILAKFKKRNIWKAWFLLAVIVTMYKAFDAFIPSLIAFIIAFVLALYKIYKPNVYIHNFTELFIYAGLAAIFVPIMNVISASILLILIAIYDAFAVWKSKHMITLAKFQAESVFAGLTINYDEKNNKIIKSNLNIPKPTKKIKKKTQKVKQAILGGGDIAFPLLFAGVVMNQLMLTEPVLLSFVKAVIISLFATVALWYLLMNSEKNKFYPAMPFISAGCFIGYGVVLLIGLIS